MASDKTYSKNDLIKIINRLQSELKYYKEEVKKYKGKEVVDLELIEEIKELQELHNKEKEELHERIELLTGLINNQTEESLNEDEVNQLSERIKELEEKIEEQSKVIAEYEKQAVSKYDDQDSDNWFFRNLKAQKAIR